MKTPCSSPVKVRMGLRRFVTFVVVVLVVYLVAAVVFFFVGPAPSRRAVAEGRSRLYESWCVQNKDAYEGFKRLARANGWQMYARTNEGLHFSWGWGGIGCLDYGRSTYKSLHEATKDWFIGAVTPFQDGKGAFIESITEFSWPWRKIKRQDFELGVVHRNRAVTKVPLANIEYAASIAIGNRYVLLPDHSAYPPRLWLYDLRENSLRAVPTPQGWEGIVEKLAISGDRFLLTLSTREVMNVIRATVPHAEVSRIEGVSDMLLVGEHIVIKTHDGCLLYDPESGGTERLTPGQPLLAAGGDTFLFCEPEAPHHASTRAGIYRYGILTRRAELLWKPLKEQRGFRIEPGREKDYDYRKIMLSPDGHFLFVPWQIPTSWYKRQESVMTFEYEVYDLRSGEKRGSFVTIFEGKFYFKILGWDTSDQEGGPAAPEL